MYIVRRSIFKMQIHIYTQIHSNEIGTGVWISFSLTMCTPGHVILSGDLTSIYRMLIHWYFGKQQCIIFMYWEARLIQYSTIFGISINLTDFNAHSRRCILILIIDLFYFKNKMLGTSFTLSISKNRNAQYRLFFCTRLFSLDAWWEVCVHFFTVMKSVQTYKFYLV